MSHLVVALWSEARPLIAHFGLREAAPAAPFRHHRNAELSLVVSGIGKTSSAAAAAYLFAAEGARRGRPWLNVGIAGHGTMPVGEGVLAHKVEDAGSGRVWYPCPLFDLPGATAVVQTFDRVVDDYPPDVACDMEAAGFFSTACRFSPAELIHVYKVVSDGPATDKRSLDAGRVSALVAPHVETVGRLLEATGALADEIAAARPVVDSEAWLEAWRFTVSQRRRLVSLLSRLAVVAPATPVPADLGPKPVNAAAVLARLEESLAAASGIETGAAE